MLRSARSAVSMTDPLQRHSTCTRLSASWWPTSRYRDGATLPVPRLCPASSGRPRQPQCDPPSRAGTACSLVRPYGMPPPHAGTRLCDPKCSGRTRLTFRSALLTLFTAVPFDFAVGWETQEAGPAQHLAGFRLRGEGGARVFHSGCNVLTRNETGRGAILENALVPIRFCS